jgi:hypothetical protein
VATITNGQAVVLRASDAQRLQRAKRAVKDMLLRVRDAQSSGRLRAAGGKLPKPTPPGTVLAIPVIPLRDVGTGERLAKRAAEGARASVL